MPLLRPSSYTLSKLMHIVLQGWAKCPSSSGTPTAWLTPMILDMFDQAPRPEHLPQHRDQLYLEQLSFEVQSLHRWSRVIAKRIHDEREIVHNNFAAILDSLASAHQVNTWTRPQMVPPKQMGHMAPPLQQPQVPQAQPPNQTLQVKPALVSRFIGTPSSSSTGPPPPSNQRAQDPWMRNWKCTEAIEYRRPPHYEDA